MLADPAGAVRELADLLEAAWRALVEPEWPRLRALLEADVAYHSRRLADGGFERLIGELSPQLRWGGGATTGGAAGEGATGGGASSPSSGRTATTSACSAARGSS